MVLGLLAVLVLALGLFVDTTLGARLRSDLQARLVDRAQQGEDLAGRTPPQELVDRISGNGIAARLVTADGQRYGRAEVVVEGSSGPPARPGDPGDPAGAASGGPAAPGGPEGPGGPGGPDRVVTSGDLASTTRDLADGSTLTVVADGSSITSTLTTLRVIIVVGGLVVLALAALLLGRVVTVALRPLGTMTALARSITAGDRGSRLRPDRGDTEIGAVAAAFDEALDALEGAEARAREAEGRMRAFLADASHELRTPVAGIQSAAETLLRTNPGREAREDLAVTMVRETRRTGRLLSDLTDAARLDGGLDLERAPVDVLRLVEEQARRVRTLSPGLTVTCEREDGAPERVVGDAGRLGQVLANLLTNAANATAGRGHVRVSARGGTMSPGGAGGAGGAGSPGSAEGGWVHVDVDDDGPGVPPDQRERVFERLVRLDPSRQRGTGGSGLGLAIARAIAVAHGGDLACLPPPGGAGARFRLSLPAPGGGPAA